MIGVITLTSFMYYNYGGVLQNYALVSYLNKQGIETKGIDCNSFSMSDAIRISLYEKLGIKLNKSQGKIKVNVGNGEKQKDIKFKKFIKDNIKTRSYAVYNKATYKKIDNCFDKIIVGSDQVWNPLFMRDKKAFEHYFLAFIPSEKRISYAASFGISTIPDKYGLEYTDYLKEFSAISVREEAGAEIVRELSGRDAEVLIDPTMLLTAEEWRGVSQKASCRGNKPYLLKYFLGEQTNERRAYIQKIADEHNLEVYEMMDEKNTELFNAGPGEFLDLIEHASLICTDSFHATVFSILFNNPFLIMERTEKNMENMNSRLATLLNKLELNNQVSIDGKEGDILKCDYGRAYEILDLERIKANEFLKRALECNKK